MVFRLSISRLLDRLLPRSCLLCGDPATAQAVCAACAGDLPRLPLHPCPVCATPLPHPATSCGACLAAPPAFDATFAVWHYGFPLDALIQMLKFRGRPFAHRMAGADFLARGMLAGIHPQGTLVVPVPLSRERLRERGFNQALEMARPLARALRLPLAAGTLERVRETAPQSRLPWRARHGNVRNAFACRRDLDGAEVIVVDDVMTTGATLDAVAHALKQHGAARVSNWVAARAVKETI